MSRAPLPYSSKILELFRNPKNLGKMEDATVCAIAGSPACGDMIAFYLKINEDEVIEKATFESRFHGRKLQMKSVAYPL